MLCAHRFSTGAAQSLLHASIRRTSTRVGANGPGRSRAALLAATTITCSLAYLHLSNNAIQGDASTPESADSRQPSQISVVALSAAENLTCLVWGSNKNSLIAPNLTKSIKVPQPSSALLDKALRDLALHEQHGACIDARGDLYQWGVGFAEEPCQPRRTLSDLNLSQLAVTSSKVFALSEKSGKIYAVSSKSTGQQRAPHDWPWRSNPSLDFVEILADSALKPREKFTSISAGSDHMLALTSSGRAFALPVSMNANTCGQLGFRKIDVALSSKDNETQSIELTPTAVRDPYATATPFRRTARTENKPADVDVADVLPLPPISQLQPRDIAEDTSIRFCTTLHEIPALRDLKIEQLTAGSRSSYARTGGRVLAWGANESGQLGLGANITLPYVTVPSEVSLSRSSSSGGVSSRCSSIAAAGDLAYFVVQRSALESNTYINEVLACGQGQWGSLGNGIFSSSQGSPTRVKAASGLMEYNEKTERVQPLEIHDLTVSPTGHVHLTFETLAQAGPGGINGRDVITWGLNRDYELGNGKRTSLAVPVNIPGDEGKGMRMMLLEKSAEVRDMRGGRWNRSAKVQQSAVGGYGCTIVYWKIVT